MREATNGFSAGSVDAVGTFAVAAIASHAMREEMLKQLSGGIGR